jgi:hypothetical protein
MKGSDISFLFDTAPALHMLRLRNAHWVLPFLYKVFKEKAVFSLPEFSLTTLLAETLSMHHEGIEDWEEAKIEFGEDEESRARKYLLNWVQKRLLQDFPTADGTTMYQLSAHTEKVFQWLQTLSRRDFVGTESRFKMLFNSLHDIVEKTEDDRFKRLEELKSKRADIDREINALEHGASVEVYSNAQVEERLEMFTRLCYELLGDFREVEDNFRQIHRNIVEQHTRAEMNKGAIVGYAFDAYDALRNSNQGRSFYAFWDFLISRAGQEEWRQLTSQLLELLQLRNIDSDYYFLDNIKSMLLEQGRVVYEANDKMAEKLSRIITEKELAQHKRLRQQIGGIKELVLQLMDQDSVPCSIKVEGSAEIKLSMDRKLLQEPRNMPAMVKQPVGGSETIEDMERFSRMLNTPFVDKKKLWQNVEDILKNKHTATLREIIEIAGLEHGLSEVVAYFSFVKDKGGKAQIMSSMSEHIALNSEGTRFIEVPYLLFNR